MNNDITKPSESTTTYTELRAAAEELLNYVSFASLSEIQDTKVAINEATAKVNGKTESAKVCELLLGSNGSIPLIDEAERVLKESNTGDDILFASVNPVPDKQLPGDASKKVVSIMQHAAQSSVDYASVLSDISALFCSIIPPLELSLCVPYFDVRIIYPQEANGLGSLSTLSFVALASKNATGDSIISRGYSSTDSGIKIGFDVAGMEIFCTPQTIAAATADLNSEDSIAARGVAVLNPLVPLLTLESANIQQVGINGSLYAQTKIDLKMTLHDRSRLSDVEPLVSAEIFPTSTFRISYGWSHPDTNKMTGNVYAKLINAMKVTQDFSISSVSISSAESTAMSLSISLISQGSFTAKSAKIITANGEYLPYTAIQTLVSQIINIRNSSAKKDQSFTSYSRVGTKILASANGSSSSSRLVSLSNFYNLYNSIQDILGDDKGAAAKVQEIINKLNTAEIDTNTKDYADISAGELEKVFSFKLVSGKSGYSDIENPGFYTQQSSLVPDALKVWVSEVQTVDNLSFSSGVASGGTTYAPVVPLSAIVYRLVAVPLILTQPDIDEVRMHFFSFNSACGEMAQENIGNFPIIVSEMIHRAEDDKGLTQKSSIESAITKILNQVNTPGNRFFGVSEYLNNVEAAAKAAQTASSGESASDRQDEINTAVSNAKRLVSAKNAGILERKNITGVGDAFVPARVKHQIEILPAYDSDGSSDKPNKKIARIIFYDERSGNFNKIANIVFSMISNNNTVRLNAKTDSLSSQVKSFLTTPVNAKDSAGNEYNLYSLKDKRSAKLLAENLYPTIRIGSDAAVIMGASYTSQPAGDLQSVYLLSALTDSAPGSSTGASSNSAIIDDVFIIPSTVTLTMLGNTCIARGQTYYIDFNTGTTLDNAYTVTAVSHTIRPGTFTTTATLAPLGAASMKSVQVQLQELQNIVNQNTSTTVK
jgi:hypothetical protein